MKKTVSLALVFVLLLAAMGAAALAAANQAGMLDFVSRFAHSYIPEDAQTHVKTEDTAFENDLFSVRLRETYYDGRALRLTVDITPKEKHTLLIGMDASTRDSWQDLIHLHHEEMNPEDERSILEASKDLGYDQIWRTEVFLRPSGDSAAWGDYVLNPEDGTLTCFISEEWMNREDERELTLYVQSTPAANAELDRFDYAGHTLLQHVLHVRISSASERYISSEPVVFEEIGVRVDSLSLEVLPLDIYAVIQYTVIDEDAFAKTDDGLWFEFIDPESSETSFVKQRLTTGLSGGGSVVETAPGQYRQSESLGRSEVHESYTLRAFECWEKERFDTHTIPVLAEE